MVTMFTGIIQKVLKYSFDSGVITFKNSDFFDNTSLGDSICVNGVCLTINTKNDSEVTFIVSDETERLTNLKYTEYANMEKAMVWGVSKIGGHIVSGHVMCHGYIEEIKILDDSYDFYFKVYKNSKIKNNKLGNQLIYKQNK